MTKINYMFVILIVGFSCLGMSLHADDPTYANPYRSIPTEKAASILIGKWGDKDTLVNAVRISHRDFVRDLFNQIKSPVPVRSKLYAFDSFIIVVLDANNQVLAGLEYWPVSKPSEVVVPREITKKGNEYYINVGPMKYRDMGMPIKDFDKQVRRYVDIWKIP
jgi:hypothetical protein